MFYISRKDRPLAGVGALAVAGAIALLAIGGCGGSSPSTGSTSGQGSGTAVTSTANPAPAAASGSCANIKADTIHRALGGQITSNGSDGSSWTSNTSHTTLQCSTRSTQWPDSIVGTYTVAINGVQSPCTDGTFATAGGSPAVGAFCPAGQAGYIGLILQSDVEPAGSSSTFYPIGTDQQEWVAQAMKEALGH